MNIYDSSQSLADFTAELAKELDIEPGVWHALEDGMTVSGRVLMAGDEIKIDEHLIESARGRDGVSWAEDLSDESQVARWGVVRFREGALVTNPTLKEQIDRDAARLVEEMDLERRRLNHKYGRKVN